MEEENKRKAVVCYDSFWEVGRDLHRKDIAHCAACLLQCPGSQIEIRYANIDQQAKYSNLCGVFACMNIALLVNMKNPTKFTWKHHEQHSIRENLFNSIQQKNSKILENMAAYQGDQDPEIVTTEPYRIYCSCRSIQRSLDSSFKGMAKMVQCDACKEWFHQRCTGLPDDYFKERGTVFFVHDDCIEKEKFPRALNTVDIRQKIAETEHLTTFSFRYGSRSSPISHCELNRDDYVRLVVATSGEEAFPNDEV